MINNYSKTLNIISGLFEDNNVKMICLPSASACDANASRMVAAYPFLTDNIK